MVNGMIGMMHCNSKVTYNKPKKKFL